MAYYTKNSLILLDGEGKVTLEQVMTNYRGIRYVSTHLTNHKRIYTFM